MKHKFDVLALFQAAENGDPEAQYKWGKIFSVINGAEESLLWYRKAAEQGHARAQYELSYMLEARAGFKPAAIATARSWCQKAAAQGEPGALNRLGEMYRRGDGVEYDPAQAEECFRKAVEQYRKAAEEGEKEAQFGLGFMLTNGKGVVENQVEAAEWFRKAAENGHTGAMDALALMYFYGNGVPQDVKMGREWGHKSQKLDEENTQRCFQAIEQIRSR